MTRASWRCCFCELCSRKARIQQPARKAVLQAPGADGCEAVGRAEGDGVGGEQAIADRGADPFAQVAGGKPRCVPGQEGVMYAKVLYAVRR